MPSRTPTPDPAPADTGAAPVPEDLRDLFEAGPGYLSACTMGLPTRETVERLRARLAHLQELHEAQQTSDPRVRLPTPLSLPLALPLPRLGSLRGAV